MLSFQLGRMHLPWLTLGRLDGRIVSVSFAACFPLLFIAFNLDVVGRFWVATWRSIRRLWKKYKSKMVPGVILPGIVLAINAAILAAVWTVPMDRGFKAGVTACLFIIEVLVFVGWGVHKLVSIARRDLSASSESTADTRTFSAILDN